MRKTAMIALFAAAFGGAVGLMPGAASAGQIGSKLGASPDVIQPVQYYGGGHYYGDDWERRRYWRERRRAHDEARIAEAARQEAYRIEQERAERRAWRRAQRQHYDYYRGY